MSDPVPTPLATLAPTADAAPTAAIDTQIAPSAPPLPASEVTSTTATTATGTPAPAVGHAELQLSTQALLVLLYPLLLLVGIRLLRISLRGVRTWGRRQGHRFEHWLIEAGAPRARARGARAGVENVLRLGEVAGYLLFVYAASVYFFVLFPQTRDLGLGLATVAWGPLRQAFARMLLVSGYVAVAFVVFLVARWGIARIRGRLGVAGALPTTAHEREHLIILRVVSAAVWFAAGTLVLLILPAPINLIGLGLVILVMLALLVAFRETLENLAAGFTVGRLYDLPPATTVRIGALVGRIAAWGPLDLRLELEDGSRAAVPYRVLQREPLQVLDDGS